MEFASDIVLSLFWGFCPRITGSRECRRKIDSRWYLGLTGMSTLRNFPSSINAAVTSGNTRCVWRSLACLAKPLSRDRALTKNHWSSSKTRASRSRVFGNVPRAANDDEIAQGAWLARVAEEWLRICARSGFWVETR